MKKTAIGSTAYSHIRILLLTAVLLCGAMTGCRFSLSEIGKSDYRYDDADSYLVGEGSCGEEIRTLDIDWVSGEVEILTHDGDTVEFYEELDDEIPEELRMRYHLNGDTLKIKFCASGQWNWEDLQKKLTVLVPEEMSLESIRADTVSAPVNIWRVDVQDVEADTASGSVSLESMDRMGKLEADTVSGNVSVEAAAAARIKIGTASGSVKVRLEEGTDHLDVETVSGSVTVRSKGAMEYLEIGTASGSVAVESEETVDHLGIETVSGAAAVRSAGAMEYLEIETASGRVEATADRVRELAIETVSGAVILELNGESRGEVGTTSGEVSVTIPESVGFDVDYSSVSGEFSSDLSYDADRERYVSGDGGCRLQVETVSGNMKIGKTR